MLALVVITLLLILSIRSYQGYRVRANFQLLSSAVNQIELAATSYFLSNCSTGVSNLELGQWRPISDLSAHLVDNEPLNPLGGALSFQYQQVNNQIFICIKAPLDEAYDAKDVYGAVNGQSYSSAPPEEGIYCQDAKDNAVIWQTLPTLEKSRYYNPQIVKRLLDFKKNNMSASSVCQ